MKSRISAEKTVPVPARGEFFKKGNAHRFAKGTAAAAVILLLAAGSIYMGMKTAPETEIPVALADGSVIMPPYYITIDGKRTALVESKEAAEEAVQKVIEEYEGDPEDVIDIYVEEETGTEKMDIKTGDEPPDILTAEEAKEYLIGAGDNVEDDSGNASQLTVVVTKEEQEIDIIQCDEERRPASEMYVGETKVESIGSNGVKKTTKKVVCENGKRIDEEIVEEEMIKEPVDEVILTGTKSYDGQGGGEGAIDQGVSYDEDASYDVLTTPVPAVNISSPFGPRWGRFHSGVDFALAQGNPIYAADDGTVYYAGYSGGYGKLIKVDHGNGMQTYYAHCSSIAVAEGQQVEAGETIGLIGSTGNSTGPHLHFEVIINGNRVDPLDFLGLE